MPNPLVEAVEKAFQDSRSRETSLAARLKYVADEVRVRSSVFAEAVDTFVGRLQLSGAGAGAPQVGERMPSFLLPDEQGHLVSLDKLLERAPVAMAFHHGHWCPYCRLNAVGLAEIERQIDPVQIVAISAETQQFTRKLKAESGANFPFLTDVGNGYALALNMAIWVDDEMSSLIAQAGWDIPSYQGADGWVLPVTSAFVVGQDGLIKTRHIDADYRRRLEPAALLAAALASGG